MILKLYHPAAAFLYFVGMLVMLFTCANPIYRVILTAGVIFLAFSCAGGKALWLSLRFLLPVCLFFALINPLLVRRGVTILFYFFGNPVTLESAAFGLNQSLLILSAVVLFISFNKIIDQAAFLYLTAGYIPRTALVVSMALNAAARYKSRAKSLLEIQETRGIKFFGNKTTSKIRAGLFFLHLFTVRSLEEGMETATVLKARDYGMAKRTVYRAYAFGLRDGASICVFAALLAAVLYGTGNYDFYPALQPLTISFAIVPLLCYVLWPFLLGIIHGR
jgi:energy-coupling factor transport system permease protein